MNLRRDQRVSRPVAQRGISLFGLLFWAVMIAFVGVLAIKVLPTLNEYFTIVRTINKIKDSGPTTVTEVRQAFNKQKDIEYSISSISGSDLEIENVGDRLTIRFAYDKEIVIMEPVYLLIKFRGASH
jgi:hypothetical protein